MTSWASLSPMAKSVVIVMGILVLATLSLLIARTVSPARDYKELSDRIKSWWVMTAVFFVAHALPMPAALVFWAVVCFWALKEFFTLVRGRWEDRPAMFWAYVAIPFQFLWIGISWYGMFVIFIPVYVFLWTGFVLVLQETTAGFVASVSRIHWGLMTFVFGLSHAANLLALPPLPGFEAGGKGLLLYLVLLTQGNDVFQYLTGKSFGRHRIAPTVSPNKTWEGFLGGIALTTTAATLLRFLTPLSLPASIGAGLLISVFGFMGDIVVAAVKRDVGVKDASSAIPGHGGVLDRVNSLACTAPLFFHYMRYLAY
jgi:phosphatidate cytidylyltransferase